MNPPGTMLGRIPHRAAIIGYLAFGGTDGNALNVTPVIVWISST
jgi:hypothetical protein